MYLLSSDLFQIKAQKLNSDNVNNIIRLLESKEDGHHEIAFSLLESLGAPADKDLANVISGNANFLFRAFEQDWKPLLELIKEVTLNFQALQSLPDGFYKMINVEYLEMNHCHLKNLSNCIEHFGKLYSVTLNYNDLTCLPDTFNSLENMLELSLVGNQFKSFPKQIFKLKKLQMLSLIDNQINELPKGLVELTELKKLLLRNNELFEIPLEVCMLENLELLDLSDNKISKLPNAISNLKNLRTLYLDRNKLSKSEKQKISYLLPKAIIHF